MGYASYDVSSLLEAADCVCSEDDMEKYTPSSLDTVDVRDMLCAQALSVVAKALKALPQEAGLSVICDREDVRRDLKSWVDVRGYAINEIEAGRLVILRGINRG